MYDYEDDGLDKKTRKKLNKIIRNAASAIGGGVGLILMKGFFSVDVPQARDLFNGLGLWLIVFGVIVLATAIFRRDWVFHINSTMIFMVTPCVVIKLVLDAM